jgi:hypothetical protein
MKAKDNIKLLEVKTVAVGKDKYPVKLTFRAMIDYETMTGRSVAYATSTEDVTRLLYCAAKAGAKSTGTEFTYDYIGFLDMIDEHPEALMNFYDALVEGDPDEKKQVRKVNLT